MNDPEIRATLVEHLRKSDASASVLHEVPIRYARGHFDAGRADVLAVSGFVFGYEIKSEADNRARLRRQVPAYEAICDFCTIVVGLRHLPHVRATLPASWGILVATDGGLRRERQATRNVDVDPAAIARQLWKDECVAMLKEHGMTPARRAYVHDLWPLVEALPIDALRARLRVALVDHENALKDIRVERREERRRRVERERAHREAQDRLLAEWAARAAEVPC